MKFKCYNLLDYLAEHIIRELPHGSGIDGDWSYHINTDGSIRFSNGIHCMNQDGYYDGWQAFTILLNTQDFSDFRIMFNQPRKEYYIFLWRDPLEEMISLALKYAEKNIIRFLEKNK